MPDSSTHAETAVPFERAVIVVSNALGAALYLLGGRRRARTGAGT